jgi:hypothetical protein
MVCQSKPVQVTRYTGLRNESWARRRDQELGLSGREKAGVNPELIPYERYRADQPIPYHIEEVSPYVLRGVGSPTSYGLQNQSRIVPVMRLGKGEFPGQFVSVV